MIDYEDSPDQYPATPPQALDTPYHSDPMAIDGWFRPVPLTERHTGGWVIQFVPQMHICDNCGKTGFMIQETVIAHVILCKSCNDVFEALDRDENGMELTENFVSAISARNRRRHA